MRPLLFPLFLLSLCFGLWSSCKQPTQGSTQTPEEVSVILHKADSLRKAGVFDTAISEYQKALPLLRKQDDSLGRWLDTQRWIAMILSKKQKKRAESLLLKKVV